MTILATAPIRAPRTLDDLFADALRDAERMAPGLLLLAFDGSDEVEADARRLLTTDPGCAFVRFTVHREDGEVVVEVRAPESRPEILEGLVVRAMSAGR
ncbi:hypothetical protein GCM10023215_41850 [Pseudonocardia yuanmonensis]|uniref:Uncharacterized protein n=1 Tax=Pseudonocardia yuanmonensis TaxID=1095914 RepID=A0ABP8X5D0_9PSEU